MKNLKIIIATKNQGKVKEIASFFSDLPLDLMSLSDYSPEIKLPLENGKTFSENALKKAKAVWKITKGWVLADDSGLECDDLGGKPGIYSARFAGPHSTDEENNRKLLKEFQDIHDPTRIARYVCALALIEPSGQEHLIEKTCEGVITMVPSGAGGFGYDPYFYLSDKKCTMAELPLSVKNQISHRGKALRQVHDFLKSSILLCSPNPSKQKP